MTDIEICKNGKKLNIIEVSKKLNIENNIELYGCDKAKIKFDEINQNNNGKVILVTSINPTPYGEGKTTVSIGLNDGLNKIGKKKYSSFKRTIYGTCFWN